MVCPWHMFGPILDTGEKRTCSVIRYTVLMRRSGYDGVYNPPEAGRRQERGGSGSGWKWHALLVVTARDDLRYLYLAMSCHARRQDTLRPEGANKMEIPIWYVISYLSIFRE